MNEVEKITEELILREFQMEKGANKEAILQALTQAIIVLLLRDLEKLWNILYRIDVNERKVKALFDKSNPQEIAPEMAKLIYERMEQKAISRIQYRS
ncbi:MAG: hypothetical protein K9H61_04180 [Bacteroidia bacterium]|nr:hypothetical protein [Bacteroidia bacterium]MCF8426406.1 hypothetical protein [Bacteroidia bacterium]MCF8446174.1 hypothetical protein [Bacteroidia bacterium]